MPPALPRSASRALEALGTAAIRWSRIHPPTDRRGFLGYLLVYQVLVSAAALRGYGQYLLGSGRRWS